MSATKRGTDLCLYGKNTHYQIKFEYSVLLSITQRHGVPVDVNDDDDDYDHDHGKVNHLL